MSRNLLVIEAAEHLRVSTRTVYELLESGKLRGFRIGRAWRISEDELRRFAGHDRVGPTA
jgi:excisionase family DNA binding protein